MLISKHIRGGGAPLVVIDRNTHARITYLVEKCPTECMWYCSILVERTPKNTLYYVSNVFIPPQEVTGATVESSANEMYEMWQNYSTEDQDRYMETCRVWCHSHVNMPTSPSGTDEKQWTDWVTAVNYPTETDTVPMMMIWNKQGSVFTRVLDEKAGFIYEGIPITIQDEFETDDIDRAMKSFRKPANRLTGAGVSVFDMLGKRDLSSLQGSLGTYYKNLADQKPSNDTSWRIDELRDSSSYELAPAEQAELKNIISVITSDSYRELKKVSDKALKILDVDTKDKANYWGFFLDALARPDLLYNVTKKHYISDKTSYTDFWKAVKLCNLSNSLIVEILDTALYMWNNEATLEPADWRAIVTELCDLQVPNAQVGLL